MMSTSADSRSRRIAGILTHAVGLAGECRRRGVNPPTARPPSRRGRRLADAAGTVADARRVGERRENDAIGFADPLLVDAATPADDVRARAADQRRRRALELQELRLHRAAEGVVAPGPVAANDAMAGDDHRHGIGSERVAHRARRARAAYAARQGRVRIDLAELDAVGLREHASLEVADTIQIDRDREERPASGQVLAKLLPGALGVGACAGGGPVVAAARVEPRPATLGRVDPEPVGQLLQARWTALEPSEETLRQFRRSLGLEELFEHRVDSIHVAIPPAPSSRSPCLARADS